MHHRQRFSLWAVMLLVWGVIFLALGVGGAANSDPTPSREAQPQPAAAAPVRRGIQSIYFLALQSDFAKAICDKLKSAPASRKIEIEFCPAYDDGKGWANARTAVSTLKARGLSLVVDFGHHTVAPDKSPNDWGKSLFTESFKTNWNTVDFVLQLANEDTYTNDQWKSLMSQVLTGLRSAWTSDAATRSTAFPYSRLKLRRTGAAVPADFRFDGKSFTTESEYHFPAGSSANWNSTAQAISNDGQVVYRPGTDPNPWAYDGRTPLRQVSLTDFTSNYGGRTLLLWHPALHRWSFSNNAYRKEGTRSDPNTANRNAFLGLLEAFMK